jgi:GMP synthase (glutamine-hydrolysing)
LKGRDKKNKRKEKMKTLLIKHEETEGLGILEEYMLSLGDDVHIVKLYQGEELPDLIEYFDAIISMGGEMNVNEDLIYPFLLEEILMLEKAIKLEIPVLGFNLGAELLAEACGAKVTRATQMELGFSEVDLTYMGMQDPLFAGMPLKMPVFEWHEDTFEVPLGGILLATSDACPNQAFRYHKAYGLQFHMEINSDIIQEWFDEQGMRDELMIRFKKMEPDFVRLAKRLYRNFTALTS